MKYLTSLFWILVYGQVLGYIGSALTSSSYKPQTALIVSVIFTIVFWILAACLESSDSKKE
ncbi:YjzD family protein [Bombilactobacillus folatiphilus]|uniref:YjzD family protein n=1 Tax=Bombilactobacillus folatiphilus TaxID=2923362 RepID=A0ABY4PAW3_9LACO|nr:YjzD family protein [Bombilactobacillus folatiphilus]UQS82765.1 YjzD family protein [Bombilactobacillus folatiphilus]